MTNLNVQSLNDDDLIELFLACDDDDEEGMREYEEEIERRHLQDRVMQIIDAIERNKNEG